MMKTEIVKLRVTPELKEQLKALADAENRTVSNYLELLIKRDIDHRTSTYKEDN